MVSAINVSRGGVPKEGVFEALETASGLDGDRQADRRFHGRPDQTIVSPGRFSRISQNLHPGSSRVSARVLAGGIVHVNDRRRQCVFLTGVFFD